MQHGCVALALDKRYRPIEISAFRWSSAETAWAGFPVESHVLGPRGQLGEYGIDQALLGLCRVRDVVRRVVSSPGRFSLLGPGFEQKPLSRSGTREVLFVAIGAEQLERFMGHDPDLARLNVNLQCAVADPHVASLVLNMREELQAGCPTGKLYGEALSLALASYLFKRYSVESRPEGRDGLGLSPRQVTRVREYIRTNLAREEALSLALAAYLFKQYSVESGPVGRDGLGLSPTQISRVREYIRTNVARDIGLAELADQVGLSPHYFSMLFKHALGASPHHYVLRERIHEAQRLLAAGRMSISEVALCVGFSDQSHFSQAFRKMTGTTPKRYQSTC